MSEFNNKRFICPCCGYPTLDERAGYDICILCDWEDDGQSDLDADLIKGGPNGDYSLTEARENFKKYIVMYSSDRDMRITGCDTKEDMIIKKELSKVYNKIMKEKNGVKLDRLWHLVYNLEDRLYKITSNKIKKYNRKEL